MGFQIKLPSFHQLPSTTNRLGGHRVDPGADHLVLLGVVADRDGALGDRNGQLGREGHSPGAAAPRRRCKPLWTAASATYATPANKPPPRCRASMRLPMAIDLRCPHEQASLELSRRRSGRKDLQVHLCGHSLARAFTNSGRPHDDQLRLAATQPHILDRLDKRTRRT